MLHIVMWFISINFKHKKVNKEGTTMNKSNRKDIPYFLTKEYGDKQRRKQKIVFVTCMVFCLGILAIKTIWF